MRRTSPGGEAEVQRGVLLVERHAEEQEENTAGCQSKEKSSGEGQRGTGLRAGTGKTGSLSTRGSPGNGSGGGMPGARPARGRAAVSDLRCRIASSVRINTPIAIRAPPIPLKLNAKLDTNPPANRTDCDDREVPHRAGQIAVDLLIDGNDAPRQRRRQRRRRVPGAGCPGGRWRRCRDRDCRPSPGQFGQVKRGGEPSRIRERRLAAGTGNLLRHVQRPSMPSPGAVVAIVTGYPSTGPPPSAARPARRAVPPRPREHHNRFGRARNPQLRSRVIRVPPDQHPRVISTQKQVARHRSQRREPHQRQRHPQRPATRRSRNTATPAASSADRPRPLRSA